MSRDTDSSLQPRGSNLAGDGTVRSMMNGMAGVVAGAGAGAILPFLITAWFGAGARTDAYFLVFGGAIFLGASAAASIEATTLPLVVEAQIAGAAAVRSLTNRIAAIVGAAGTAVVVGVLLLGAAWWTPPLGERSTAIAHMTPIIAPLPILMAISGVFAAALYAFDRFGAPSYLLVWRSGLALVFGAAYGSRTNLQPVVVGLVLGELVRVAWMRHRLQSRLGCLDDGGSKLPVRWSPWKVAAPQAMAQYALAANPLIDRFFAAAVGIGSVTIIELSEKLYYVPVLLITAVVANVSAAKWSRLLVSAENLRLQRDFRMTILVGAAGSAVAAVIATAVLWAIRDVIASALGFDDPRELPATATIYLAGLPFTLAQVLAMRLLTSMKKTSLLAAVSLMAVVVNAVGDLWASRHLGTQGIALTTTVVTAASALFYVWYANRAIRGAAADTST